MSIQAEKRARSERLAYYRLMGVQALRVLSEKGNYVGEKADPRYDLDDYVHDHEAAYQFRKNEEANGLSVPLED